MMARKIARWIAPPVADAEKRLADARSKNAAAERTLTDLRDRVDEALALSQARREVPNGTGK